MENNSSEVATRLNVKAGSKVYVYDDLQKRAREGTIIGNLPSQVQVKFDDAPEPISYQVTKFEQMGFVIGSHDEFLEFKQAKELEAIRLNRIEEIKKKYI